MALASPKHLKFRARSWLNRLGVWQRIESWRLERRFRRGFIHEPDFNPFRRFEGNRGLFVDVGANIGQSALSFRVVNKTSPILSFEPNPEMEFGLRTVKKLLGAGFDYRMHGLGERTETKTLYAPFVNGTPLSQFATFRPEGLEATPERRRMFKEITGVDGFDVVKQSLHLVRFDELELAPEFVKIDVEGTEIDVLAGMEETLSRCRPLIMTEGNAAQPHLEARGYRMYAHNSASNTLSPATGAVGLNFFFVAEEKVADLTKREVIQTS